MKLIDVVNNLKNKASKTFAGSLIWKSLIRIFNQSGFIMIFFITLWSIFYAAYEDVFLDGDSEVRIMLPFNQKKFDSYKLQPSANVKKHINYYMIIDETLSSDESYFFDYKENTSACFERADFITSITEEDCKYITNNNCRDKCFEFLDKKEEVNLIKSKYVEMLSTHYKQSPLSKNELKRLFSAGVIDKLISTSKNAKNTKQGLQVLVFDGDELNYISKQDDGETEESDPKPLKNGTCKKLVTQILNSKTSKSTEESDFKKLIKGIDEKIITEKSDEEIQIINIVSDFYDDKNQLSKLIISELEKMAANNSIYINLFRLPTANLERSNQVTSMFKRYIPMDRIAEYHIANLFTQDMEEFGLIQAAKIVPTYSNNDKLIFNYVDKEIAEGGTTIDFGNNSGDDNRYTIKLLGENTLKENNFLKWQQTGDNGEKMETDGHKGTMRIGDRIIIETGNILNLKLNINDVPKKSDDLALEIYQENTTFKYRIPIEFNKMLPTQIAWVMRWIARLILVFFILFLSNICYRIYNYSIHYKNYQAKLDELLGSHYTLEQKEDIELIRNLENELIEKGKVHVEVEDDKVTFLFEYDKAFDNFIDNTDYVNVPIIKHIKSKNNNTDADIGTNTHADTSTNTDETKAILKKWTVTNAYHRKVRQNKEKYHKLDFK